VISTAKFPPLRIAACGSSLIMAGLKTGHYNAAEQPSCRQLAGRDLVPEAGTELFASSPSD
jgi:hypothetical protein